MLSYFGYFVITKWYIVIMLIIVKWYQFYLFFKMYSSDIRIPILKIVKSINNLWIGDVQISELLNE